MALCCMDLAKSITVGREGWGERKNTTEAQRHLGETLGCAWVLPPQGPCQAPVRDRALLMAHFIPSGRDTGSWFKVAASFKQQRGR